jgi:hypothetical protein
LAAIQALDVIHAVAPGNDLGAVMFTSCLHKARLLGFILSVLNAVSRG